MRLVPINSVKKDSILAKTIYNSNGIVLLREGIPLNSTLIERALNNGIYSLYIHDEYSSEIIEDIISPDLRTKAIFTLKSSYNDLEHTKKYLSSNKFSNIKKVNETIQNITSLAKEFVNNILSQNNIIINLVDIKTMDNYTYQHCVNCAVLAIVHGVEMGFKQRVLESIAIGALLHDFGKVFVPKEILLKPGRLTENEIKMINTHPQKGYDYLTKHTNIDGIALSIVLEHHEKSDGSGYPYNLFSNKISKYAKMISVCDVYDALTSDRPYRKAMSPNEALELIMGSCGEDFDLDIVKAFINRIVPYPVGTLVKLSNDKVAVIKELHPDYVLRPKVNVIDRIDNQIQFTELDLIQETRIVIKGIYREKEGTL